MDYDIAVVGSGMIGAAAAKHILTLQPDLHVLLIGPNEPGSRTVTPGGQSNSTDIYGAHYDVGRITRVLDPDYSWATLARRSIANYRKLESESGESKCNLASYYYRNHWGE